MEIKETMVNELVKCEWLQYCGEQQRTQYDFDVLFYQNATKAMDTITTIKWENICLNESGNITSYLAIHNKEEYNKNWNQLVRRVKIEVFPQIVEKIQEGIRLKCLPDSIINDIKFNLVNILVSDAFSNHYRSEFYHQMYQIYISGHLPCGWDGEYPSGRIIVF